MRGHLTEKVDVFSFGVVLLEIVSGRPNSDSSLEGDKMYLLEWVWITLLPMNVAVFTLRNCFLFLALINKLLYFFHFMSYFYFLYYFGKKSRQIDHFVTKSEYKKYKKKIKLNDLLIGFHFCHVFSFLLFLCF